MLTQLFEDLRKDIDSLEKQVKTDAEAHISLQKNMMSYNEIMMN